jgi:HK97 family phage major capsid protein
MLLLRRLIKHQTLTREATKKQKTKQLEIGEQVRTLTLTRESVNMDERTVELSFSSETPVERWWGMEILGHDPGECDLSRLNNSGAFLMDHVMRDQRGVIEEAWIDAKKGRARIRLSKSERGQELLEEMRDGIRPHISVGYRIIEIIHVKRDENNVDWYRATKWQPYEISSVSVPADTAVGLGRSQDETKPTIFNVQLRGIPMDEDDLLDGGNGGEDGTRGQQAPAPQTPAPQAQRNAPVDDIASERTRCSEIQAIGAQFGLARQAAEAVANGTQLDEFRKTVLSHVRTTGNKPAGTDMDLGLSAKEREQYSLLNAIRANISGNWKKAGFEREVSVALAEKMGRDARGFMVNYEILGGLGRGQDTKTEGKGGALVATEHHSDKFIELLRPNSVAAQLGVRMVTGLVGNVDIPKMLSGSSFYWIDEGADGSESDAQFGIVKMSPKTIAGAVPITRRLMQQSTPDIDIMIRDDMLQGLGLGIDKAIFVGTGTGNEPLGIVNQSGVNAIDLTTLGLSHAALVAFETAIEEADAMTGQLHYLTRPSTKGILKTTPINANSERYLWDGNELNGYAAICAKWLAHQAILAGDFRQAMFGIWGALDLMVDKTTKAASGGTVLRVFQDGDVAVRHAKAFAYGRKI